MTRDGKKLGFTLSENDACMFMKKGLVALVYVDDVLFFGTLDKSIDNVIGDLKKNFDLSEEGTVEAFLGMEISDHNKGKLACQTLLIQ